MEGWKERRRRGENSRLLAKTPDGVLYCMGKMVGSSRPPTCTPAAATHPNPASAPATLCCVSQEGQALQLALLNPERGRETEKKKTENEREVTQLEDISRNVHAHFFQPVFFFFFPFISHFMIEFLTNTLAVQWVQTHSKKAIVWFSVPQNAVKQWNK